MDEPTEGLGGKEATSPPSRRESWERLVTPFLEADERGAEIPEYAWRSLAVKLGAALEAWFAAKQIVLRDRDAADVVQEVLIRLQDRSVRTKWTGTSYPGAYLLAMARNLVHDSQRREASGDARLAPWEREERERQSDLESEDETALADGRAAVDTIAAGMVLERLSVDDRRLLEWRYADSKSIDEIAGRLGVSYPAAAQRLFRLLRRVRNELALVREHLDK